MVSILLRKECRCVNGIAPFETRGNVRIVVSKHVTDRNFFYLLKISFSGEFVNDGKTEIVLGKTPFEALEKTLSKIADFEQDFSKRRKVCFEETSSFVPDFFNEIFFPEQRKPNRKHLRIVLRKQQHAGKFYFCVKCNGVLTGEYYLFPEKNIFTALEIALSFATSLCSAITKKFH